MCSTEDRCVYENSFVALCQTIDSEMSSCAVCVHFSIVFGFHLLSVIFTPSFFCVHTKIALNTLAYFKIVSAVIKRSVY